MLEELLHIFLALIFITTDEILINPLDEHRSKMFSATLLFKLHFWIFETSE